MQVRRKTSILEARQFTAESALELIKDGWLHSMVSMASGTSGLLTRSAGRTRDVQLGDWIVQEYVQDPTAQIMDGTGRMIETVESELGRRFRAYSAEQFSQDFEVVDDTAKAKLERARPIAERAANGDVRVESEPAAQG